MEAIEHSKTKTERQLRDRQWERAMGEEEELEQSVMTYVMKIPQ